MLGSNSIDPRWTLGPFLHLKTLAPKGKGKRFEQIAEEVLKSRGHTVAKATNTQHDRIVDGLKFEIKGSTITKGSDDMFSFLQIRPAQDYDVLLFESFWFDGTVKYHRIPKEDLLKLVSSGVFSAQHGGKKGNSGTFSWNGDLAPFEPWYWFEVKVQ